MKRGWTYSLCLAVVAATASPALAVVNVQLNLRYTDPNNATGGGTWDLLVKSTATNGLAGISVNVIGNLGVTGTDLPANAITPNAAAFDNTTSVFRYGLFNGQTQIVAGDDLVAGNLKLGVGTAGFADRTVTDDLFPVGTGPRLWDNSTRLASGSWTGARPTLGAVVANEFDTTAPTPKAILATNGTVVVRGDSVGVDGLKRGDANRDGIVNINDLSALGGSYSPPGTPGGKTWANGDFNSDGTVNINDLSALGGNYSPPGTAAPNPIGAAVGAVGAIPEPSSIALLGMALLGLGRFKKRS